MKNSDHVPPLLRFQPEVGLTPAIRQWCESNCALKRLLNHHRAVLNSASAMAAGIRQDIGRLAALMESLSRRTCRFCPEPCCIANTVWIDFRDLLMLHLLDEPIPAQQAATESGQACPFLNSRGCRLPWRMRPWMCLKYICPTQLALLKKEGRPDPAALCNRIDTIENQRLCMETEVLDRIRSKHRTGSSSPSAWPR